MKEKGFTLIELLAVIVVLAIIMVIATPIVVKTIDDAKKGAFKNTAYGIMKAAELDYSKKMVKGQKPNEIIYEYVDGKEASGETLEFKGTIPQNGKIVVNREGKVALAIHDGTYCAEKYYDEAKIIVDKKKLEDCVVKSGTTFACGKDFVDPRDGEVYKTTQIGDQCWFGEDLRYDCSKAGYTNVGSATSWSGTNNCGNQGSGYNGLLYQWPVAMNGSTEEGAQGLCPDGWHVPTDDEWKILEGTVDSTYGVGHAEWDKSGQYRGDDAGTKLKSSEYGFDAKLAGYRNLDGSLLNVGSYGDWWTSSPSGSLAWYRCLYSSRSGVLRDTHSQSYGRSVRCLLGQ